MGQTSNFCARLKELRAQAGLTQAQLAERAKLHLSAITRFEQGWREPSLATAQALADALGVKCDDFKTPASGNAKPRPRGRPRKQAAEEKPKQRRKK